MFLESWFGQRGVSLRALGPGARTPAAFSDPHAEHLATRSRSGLFDFSFMACIQITGPESLAFLEGLQVRRLATLASGRIAYTLMCREDGTVINDATVWRLGEDDYLFFTGRRADKTHVEAIASGYDVCIVDRSGRYAVCAVQGPESRHVLRRCFPGFEWDSLRYFRFCRCRYLGAACWIACMGYSGELGFEIVIEAAAAPALWQELLRVGAPSGLVECGFDAADSLRVEAGHILFARELANPVTPWELGFGRLISRFGTAFVGSEIVRAKPWGGAERRLVGLLPDSGATMADASCGERLRPGRGLLTSLCASPVFGRPLGLGFVLDADSRPGTLVRLADGSRARVARLPFYDPMKRLPRG